MELVLSVDDSMATETVAECMTSMIRRKVVIVDEKGTIAIEIEFAVAI